MKLVALVEEHIEAYPDMEPADLYLLVHEYCLGASWLAPLGVVHYRELVKRCHELDLDLEHDRDVLEDLDPKRALVRLHLRPYLRAGGSLDMAFSAWQLSAAEMAENPLKIEAALAEVMDYLRNEEPDTFSAREFSKALVEYRKANYPLIPHSPSYLESESPAYLVVSRRYLAQ